MISKQVCTKCGIMKSMSYFYKRSEDKRVSHCKECMKKTRDENKDKKKEYAKRIYVRDCETIKERTKEYYKLHIEERKKYRKEYNEKNKEYIVEKRKEYREAHKEHIAEYNKIYPKLHPEIIRKSAHKKYANRRGWGNPQPINCFFEGSELHHLHILNLETGEVDTQISIYIPRDIHKSKYHSNRDQSSMDAINEIAMEWYNIYK